LKKPQNQIKKDQSDNTTQVAAIQVITDIKNAPLTETSGGISYEVRDAPQLITKVKQTHQDKNEISSGLKYPVFKKQMPIIKPIRLNS
jgi:hypothetical protein